ncbi:hypothetical protein KJ940_11710 [Myxococcota bacterium]|nr:hypothetical protein [Myxococcota bacterium]
MRSPPPLWPLLLTLSLAYARPSAPRVVENLTQGVRFAPPFTILAEAPSNPDALYLASARGRLFTTLDGGVSWDEVSLWTERKGFYGARRPQGMAKETLFSFPRAEPKEPTVGHTIKAETTDIIDRFEPINAVVRDEFNDISYPDLAEARLAAPFGSPRPAGNLAWWVRKRRGWALGVKLKLQLFMRAAPPTSINFVSPHPKDPQRILAATDDGLLYSRDGGAAWALVLTGASPAERTINHLLRAPDQPNKVYCGTDLGLYISLDGGETWRRVADPMAARSDILWITIHPTDPREILAAMSWGILRSKDGGEHFSLIFTHSWPALKYVNRLIYDPQDPRRVLAATRDGLLISEDGGGKFERGGGALFIGQDIRSVSAGAGGQLILATRQDLWASEDGGRSWRALLFGGGQWMIRDARFSIHDPEAIWIVTDAELLRMRPQQGPLGEDIVEAFERLRAGEPDLGQIIARALARAGVDRPFVTAYRQRAALAQYLPEVYGVVDWLMIDTLNDRQAFGPDGYHFRAAGDISTVNWMVGARMNLLEAFFTMKEAEYDMEGWGNRDAERGLRETLTNLYQERRRLQIQGLERPNDRARARLMRDLRLEELTAHINALTGDALPRFSAL